MMTTIFEAIVKSDRNGRGAAGETFAAELLKAAGYDVVRRGKTRQGDLRAADKTTGEFWNIEVKTAAKRPDGKFTFQLVVDGQTNYRHADYVLLLAVSSNGVVAPYLIKTELLSDRKTITLPANANNSKWADFRVKRTVRL